MLGQTAFSAGIRLELKLRDFSLKRSRGPRNSRVLPLSKKVGMAR